MLEEARRRRLLGPGDLAQERRHAEGFVEVLRGACPGSGACTRVVDLGSGAGLPGLVVAVGLPEAEVVLVDRREARTDWLRRAAGRLGLGERVRVLTADAVVLGRSAPWRGWADGVTARAFGAPGVVAEVARPFLVEGGALVVSDAPAGPGELPPLDRWPGEGVQRAGYEGQVDRVGPAYVLLRAAAMHALPPSARTAKAIERNPLF